MDFSSRRVTDLNEQIPSLAFGCHWEQIISIYTVVSINNFSCLWEGTSDLEPGKQAPSGQVSQQQTWKRPRMLGWNRFVFLGGLSMFSSPWRAVIHRDPLCPDPQVVH